MTCGIVLRTALLLGGGLLIASVDAVTQADYDATWAHHNVAYSALNITALCEDYSATGHWVVTDHTTGERSDYYGKSGCVPFFEVLLPPVVGDDGGVTNGFQFIDHGDAVVDGNVVFITWNSTSPTFVFDWATDTFVMNDDAKFEHHQVYYQGHAIN